jgi:hypothetical protein
VSVGGWGSGKGGGRVGKGWGRREVGVARGTRKVLVGGGPCTVEWTGVEEAWRRAGYRCRGQGGGGILCCGGGGGLPSPSPYSTLPPPIILWCSWPRCHHCHPRRRRPCHPGTFVAYTAYRMLICRIFPGGRPARALGGHHGRDARRTRHTTRHVQQRTVHQMPHMTCAAQHRKHKEARARRTGEEQPGSRLDPGHLDPGLELPAALPLCLLTLVHMCFAGGPPLLVATQLNSSTLATHTSKSRQG